MKKIKLSFFIFLIILGTIFFFRNDILDFYSKLSLRLPGVEKEFIDLLKETQKQISTPPPLRAEKETPESFLTREGVIYWTNIQREKAGLPVLKENTKLNTSAELKVQDMFKNQYFAHNSPAGQGVGDLVEKNGYQYILIGENLALGNFENDEILVQGWMDSPGHRENILNSRYQEIGVAVEKGIFEGKSTWLAVQHFGLPLSACSQPDEITKSKIDSNQTQIEELRNTLEVLLAEIQSIRPKHSPLYNQKIEEYNNLVSQYNAIIEETKTLINEYNNQVKIFNECASGI